uniref:Protein-methionine-sulfoxide reductase catalytic subunit MsrP n=1 Tax=Magnetococcus massalia (strain MO-1) TaxID=451514 RepID=A0A1S7LCB5_MAGMO|nr:TAT exported heme-molybdoenzyme molybdopterin-containing subunit [Candidatus Magnetococcus massalia]
MTDQWKSDMGDSEVTDHDLYMKRRHFLQGSLLGSMGLTLGMSMGLPQLGQAAKSPAWPRQGESPMEDYKRGMFNSGEALTDYKDATGYCNFYELGSRKRDPKKNAHWLKTDPWSVAIDGEVAKPGVIQLEDLIRPHQLEERIYRLRCVEAWSMVIPWIGFPLADLIKRFEPTSRAKYVAFETLMDLKNLKGQERQMIDWPYVEGLRMDEAMNPLTLLAVGLYGKVMPNQNGAPLRLVVPWKYGFKSIKSIVRIRLSESKPPTAWNRYAPQEYGFYANVNPSVDHPRWSQAKERRIGEFRKRKTLMFNGYGDYVAGLYEGMDLAKEY